MNDIINLGYKLAKIGVITAPKDNSHNCFGDYIEDLKDCKLPFGWVYAKRDFLEPRESRISELTNKCCEKQSTDNEIQSLKDFIKFYYKYKQECIDLGGCYCKYFSDMYMHCSNSKNKDFEQVLPKEERLLYLIDNYNQLIKEEKEINASLEDLDNKILTLIKNNNGILQTEIYKKFSPLVKGEISTKLYYLEKGNIIRKEKIGNKNKLYLR